MPAHENHKISRLNLVIDAFVIGYELSLHVMAMADDAYLVGHPEWETIVAQAREFLTRANVAKE